MKLLLFFVTLLCLGLLPYSSANAEDSLDSLEFENMNDAKRIIENINIASEALLFYSQFNGTPNHEADLRLIKLRYLCSHIVDIAIDSVKSAQQYVAFDNAWKEFKDKKLTDLKQRVERIASNMYKNQERSNRSAQQNLPDLHCLVYLTTIMTSLPQDKISKWPLSMIFSIFAQFVDTKEHRDEIEKLIQKIMGNDHLKNIFNQIKGKIVNPSTSDQRNVRFVLKEINALFALAFVREHFKDNSIKESMELFNLSPLEMQKVGKILLVLFTTAAEDPIGHIESAIYLYLVKKITTHFKLPNDILLSAVFRMTEKIKINKKIRSLEAVIHEIIVQEFNGMSKSEKEFWLTDPHPFDLMELQLMYDVYVNTLGKTDTYYLLEFLPEVYNMLLTNALELLKQQNDFINRKDDEDVIRLLYPTFISICYSVQVNREQYLNDITKTNLIESEKTTKNVLALLKPHIQKYSLTTQDQISSAIKFFNERMDKIKTQNQSLKFHERSTNNLQIKHEVLNFVQVIRSNAIQICDKQLNIV